MFRRKAHALFFLPVCLCWWFVNSVCLHRWFSDHDYCCACLWVCVRVGISMWQSVCADVLYIVLRCGRGLCGLFYEQGAFSRLRFIFPRFLLVALWWPWSKCCEYSLEEITLCSLLGVVRVTVMHWTKPILALWSAFRNRANSVFEPVGIPCQAKACVLHDNGNCC